MSAQRTPIPGALVELAGLGILLTGTSGVGKSQLALELVSRGHCLVCDDAPLFERRKDGRLEGHAVPELGDFLVVRGLGVLNIRALFGDEAVKPRATLDLIVRLIPREPVIRSPEDLLAPPYTLRQHLGAQVPELELGASVGGCPGYMLEAAVRSYGLRLQGYDALEDFTTRQRRAMGADMRPARE